MTRVGILGGTFNPVHTGHLIMASGILAGLSLDHILFIPCAVPPHKGSLKLVPARHRLNMLKLAIKGNPDWQVSTVELDRGGRSYSVDTLEELGRVYKGRARFFFIIGSDTLRQLPTWKEPDRLRRLCTLVAVERPCCPIRKRDAKGVKVVNIPTLPVSSTDIRALVRQGKSIKYIVPEGVRRYILRYNLYNCG